MLLPPSFSLCKQQQQQQLTTTPLPLSLQCWKLQALNVVTKSKALKTIKESHQFRSFGNGNGSRSLKPAIAGRENGCVQSGRRLRLLVQGGSDRRLRRRKIQSLVTIHQKRIQLGIQIHHWCWIRHPQHPRRWQNCKGPNLGHRRPRKVAPFFLSSSLPCIWSHSIWIPFLVSDFFV